MTVYHGSTCEVQVPDLSRSKRFIDFGPGFYVTAMRQQAERWAKRKALRSGGRAIVSIFELAEDWSAYRAKMFAGADKEWLDFVCACRNGVSDGNRYEVISGKVADDKVYQAIDMYRRGIWDAGRTLGEIAYYEDSHQVALTSEAAIKGLLTFKASYEVE